MTTKYVKLIAKPNTWFKEGTEVFDYISTETDKIRVSLDDWNDILNFDGIKCVCVRGIRIPSTPTELKLFGSDERLDGEFCDIDEFEVEIVDKPYPSDTLPS